MRRGAHLDFGGLAAWVSCGDALAECLEAAHPCLGSAAGMVSCPSFPERAAGVVRGAQGFVPGPGGWAVLLPRSTSLADRDDCRATARDDGAVAAAGVVGAVCGHGADLRIFGDLARQVRQDGAVAFPAGGELHRADVGCGGVHGQMDLAPLATALNTMLARPLFPVAEELDPCAVHQQVQRPGSAAMGYAPPRSSACGAGSNRPERAGPARPAATAWRPFRRPV